MLKDRSSIASLSYGKNDLVIESCQASRYLQWRHKFSLSSFQMPTLKPAPGILSNQQQPRLVRVILPFVWQVIGREKTVTSNTSISNLENFNLENESGELKVSRELKDGMTQYQLGNWKMEWLNTS